MSKLPLFAVLQLVCLLLATHSVKSFQVAHAVADRSSVGSVPQKPTRRRNGFARVLPLWVSNRNEEDEDNDPSGEGPNFDWNVIGKQAELFKDMAMPYYQESSQGRTLLAVLLGLTLMNSGVSVLFSYLGKDFWTTLSERNTEEFYSVLQRYLGALVLGAPIITLYRYQREQLAVHWREWMTARTFSLYTRNRVYYNLERQRMIDNPDQRIAEDVRSFTTYSLQLVITILTSIIDLASFSVILWGIYPQLFGAIILYAGLGTILTAYFGRSLVGLNFSKLQREADLRYTLVRLRENSESIAFYAGEDLEGQAVEKRLEKVFQNRRGINTAERNLEFFTTGYRYMVQILPVAVIAPKYFANEIALGVISQSVGAFNHILSDLSIIVNQFEALSSFSAGIERLSTFYIAMKEVDLNRKFSGDADSHLRDLLSFELDSNMTETMNGNGEQPIMAGSIPSISLQGVLPGDKTILSIKDLDLVTPDQKRVLINDLSLEIKPGQHLLIVGNSGAGKSSLLRAIAGLWTIGNGTISRPMNDEVYFLPQRPYCTLGSLKDQLLYPSIEQLNVTIGETNGDGQHIVPRSHLLKQTLTDSDLLDILDKVSLLDVASLAGDGDPARGLYAVFDWSNMLSLGEQQRLAFGRLLVNRPRLAILDECTSALDMVGEARMYNLLQNMALKTVYSNGDVSEPGLTYVSVGHRPSLVAFHDKKLRLGGDKMEHEVTPIDKSSMQLPTELANM